MPYIKKENRKKIAFKTQAGPSSNVYKYIDREYIECAGDLQYSIAILIKDYIEKKGLNYQNCNDVMGALAGAQQEFYRRTVAPYEDKKIEENGDV